MTAAPPASGKGLRARGQVLDAAAALLGEGGLAAVTVDAVHARSRVSKATIYKYWPNRLCVAIDAFAEHLEHEARLPDEGTAHADLVEQVRRVAAFYTSPLGRVMIELLAAAQHDEAATALLRSRLLDTRREAVRDLWGRAVDAGEVRADLDPDVALDVAFGPVMWRLLRGEACTAADAEALAVAALRGLSTSPSSTPPRRASR